MNNYSWTFCHNDLSCVIKTPKTIIFVLSWQVKKATLQYMNDSYMTLENAHYCSFESAQMRVIFSQGAEISNDSAQELQELFYITLQNTLTDTPVDITQKIFESKELALKYVNSTYNHWKFIDPTLVTDDAEGCSTCQAH